MRRRDGRQGLRTGRGSLPRAWRLRAGLRRVRGRGPGSVRLGFVSASGGTGGSAPAATPRGPERGSRSSCGWGPVPTAPQLPASARSGLRGPGRWLLPGAPAAWLVPVCVRGGPCEDPLVGRGPGHQEWEAPPPSPVARLLRPTYRGDCADPRTRGSVTLDGGSFSAPHDGFLSVLSPIGCCVDPRAWVPAALRVGLSAAPWLVWVDPAWDASVMGVRARGARLVGTHCPAPSFILSPARRVEARGAGP